MADKPINPLDDDLLRDLGLEPREPAVPKPQEMPSSPARATAAAAPRPLTTSPGARQNPTAAVPPQAPRPQRSSLTPPSPATPEDFSQGMGRLTEDMPIQLVAVLGKKNMTLKEIIALKQGEVVDLRKLPEESVDLVANGKLVARGELVLIDGKLGVQIKQLAS